MYTGVNGHGTLGRLMYTGVNGHGTLGGLMYTGVNGHGTLGGLMYTGVNGHGTLGGLMGMVHKVGYCTRELIHMLHRQTHISVVRKMYQPPTFDKVCHIMSLNTTTDVTYIYPIQSSHEFLFTSKGCQKIVTITMNSDNYAAAAIVITPPGLGWNNWSLVTNWYVVITNKKTTTTTCGWNKLNSNKNAF